MAASASATVPVRRPVRKSSSNWLGVTKSAIGSARSLISSGTPRRTKTPRPTVADHRIAAIARRRIGALHPRDDVDHGLADVGGAEIAREHAVAFAEHAALVDALDHRADRLAAEGAAAPRAIAGVIGELHRVHRPDLDADALQREHGGGVADMAVGDVRLDREDVHARSVGWAKSLDETVRWSAIRAIPDAARPRCWRAKSRIAVQQRAATLATAQRRHSPLIRPASISRRLKRRASAPPRAGVERAAAALRMRFCSRNEGSSGRPAASCTTSGR